MELANTVMEPTAEKSTPRLMPGPLSPAATPQLQRSQPREQGGGVSPAGFPSVVTHGRRLTQLIAAFHGTVISSYRFVVTRLRVRASRRSRSRRRRLRGDGRPPCAVTHEE